MADVGTAGLPASGLPSKAALPRRLYSPSALASSSRQVLGVPVQFVLHAFQFLLEERQLLHHPGTQKGTSQPKGPLVCCRRLGG